MNEQDTSSNCDRITMKDHIQKEHLTADSNSSSSSSPSCSPVKIIIENHKFETNNEPNSPTERTDENTKHQSDDEATNESKSDTSSNEQRTSVIVQPSSHTSSTNQSPTNDSLKNAKPSFLCESKLSQSVINNLFNSSIQQKQDQTTANVTLRPSVLRIGEGSSSVTESGDDECKELKKDNTFKFAPLSDNKKSTFGNLVTSITTTSSFALSSSSSRGRETSTKSSFLNNGDNKTCSTPTNYFTENLFQQVATQSTSKNEPEMSTFSSLASSNSESTGFVFGQNLQDRVTNVSEKPKETNEPVVSQTDSVPTNNTTNTVATSSGSTGVPEKRKFENITGEEAETNVMHIYCKLFHWDTQSSSWKERGKGNLRLNDKYDEERTTSRLIMRTAGSYKLILNCLIISGMKFELTNNCMRFSNVDGIYLVKGKQMDIEQIYSLIQQRLKMLPKKSRADIIQQEEENKSIENSFEIKEKLKLTKDDDESQDASESNDGNDDSSFRTSEEPSICKDDERNTSAETVEDKSESSEEEADDQES